MAKVIWHKRVPFPGRPWVHRGQPLWPGGQHWQHWDHHWWVVYLQELKHWERLLELLQVFLLWKLVLLKIENFSLVLACKKYNFNTQYISISTFNYPVKIEYVFKINILCLKMLVKSGLEKNILKFLHAPNYFPDFIKGKNFTQNCKSNDKDDIFCAWRPPSTSEAITFEAIKI